MLTHVTWTLPAPGPFHRICVGKPPAEAGHYAALWADNCQPSFGR